MKKSPFKISLFIIITLSISVIIASLLSYKNLIGLLGAWNQSSKMNIYLKIDSTTEEKNNVVELIKKDLQVSKVSLLDRKEAGLAFQRALKGFSSGLITEDELIDLIPETIEVDLQNTLNLSEREIIFKKLAENLSALTQVDEVSYSATWLKKFEQLDTILRSAGISVFLIILVGVSYLVALMMRTYIEESKPEIEVYSILGATRWSVYRFFLKDIFIFLTGSLLIAFATVFLAFSYLKSHFNAWGLSSVISDGLRFLTILESALVVLVLFIFIFVNSFFTIQSTVNKLNQLSYD